MSIIPIRKSNKTWFELEQAVNDQLNQTLWWEANPKNLTSTQKTNTAKWRDDLYDVLAEETLEAANAQYKALMKSKPSIKTKRHKKSK